MVYADPRLAYMLVRASAPSAQHQGAEQPGRMYTGTLLIRASVDAMSREQARELKLKDLGVPSSVLNSREQG